MLASIWSVVLDFLTPLLVFGALAFIIVAYFNTNPLGHTRKFMWRRFMNWFPLGMTYAFLYMGRYNLNVAFDAIGLDKPTFGIVDGVGLLCYALGLLFVGPLVDWLGGKRGILIAAIGSALMNLLMAGVVYLRLNGRMESLTTFSVMLGVFGSLNMLFQSFGAISTIKVKSYWFHVRERGTFGAIFGTLISLGIYFAYDWGGAIKDAVQLEPKDPGLARLLLDKLFALEGQTVPAMWLLFAIPAGLMLFWALIDVLLLRDSPDQAGFDPLDTCDTSAEENNLVNPTYGQLIWRVLSNPLILMIGVVELTSGVLRDGVTKWYKPFANETGLGVPEITQHWGFWLCVTGILGGFSAGWISDRFFHSRRAPSAALMQVVMFATTAVMIVFLTLPAGDDEGAFKASRALVVGVCAVTTMMSVIGVHSIMSGTATADFGGKRAAATATGIADAFSKLGGAVQSVALGFLTTKSWTYWPMFLFPFTILGLVFAIKMWAVLPAATRRYLAEVEGKKV